MYLDKLLAILIWDVGATEAAVSVTSSWLGGVGREPIVFALGDTGGRVSILKELESQRNGRRVEALVV